jgi:photosystem II stability/assembly factor-like uncharacterized protein
MKKSILTFLFTLTIVILFSQNQWNQIHPYPTLKNLRDTHFNSEEEGWITGNDISGGSILYTNDAGVTWETQTSGSDTPYTSLFFIDDNEGWAGGWKCIYHTTNKGNTWESQQLPNVLSNIFDIFFINQNIGWAVGERNTILKTSDGGETWNTIQYSFNSDRRFYGVCFYNELNGFAVGGRSYDDYGIIMETNDGGETWIDVSPNDCYGLTSVTFIDTITGWICGYGGTGGQPAELFKTIDNGQTWMKQETENHTRFNDIHFVNQDSGMIVDANNKVFLTSNGGASWEAFAITCIGYDLRKLSFWDNNGCYAVGYNGRIVKSTNGGHTWENVGQWIGLNFTSIGLFNSYDGLAIGNSTLFRSENGGHSWTRDTILDRTGFYLSHFNDQTAYLVSTDFKMAKTSNGGDDWVLQDIPQNTYQYKDLQFLNKNTGYLCGNYGVLKKTIDGGITWEDKSLSTVYNLNSISFINEELGWLFDISGRTLLKTEDGGDSWSVNLQGGLLNMYFHDEDIGFVKTVDPRGLLKTTDGGNSWDDIIDFPSGDGFVYFINEDVGWYIAGSSVYHTYDGGITWVDNKIFDYTSIRDIFFLNENQGWLAGDVGFVATCDFTVGIGEVINCQSPISVFPNPVSNDVEIKLDDGQGKIEDVKVFNLQGQEIMHFPHLSEFNSFKFNVSGLQSGVYFIEVTTEQSENLVKFVVQ